MQPIAPPPPWHFAPRELVDDHNLVIFDDVLDVLLEQAIGAKQLRDVVDALGLRVAMLLALRFFPVLLLRRECLIQIDFREFVNQIRQYKCVWIIGIEKATALL
jgi:hypothetical protein